MKKKIKKKFPRKYATYSIQFWFDNGTGMITETSNPKKGQELKTMGLHNIGIFARGIATSDLLDSEDKKVLRDFCFEFCKATNKKSLTPTK
ncbi:MAG: hypothetical protein AAB815_03010 [Patescibacteria group bacterium]